MLVSALDCLRTKTRCRRPGCRSRPAATGRATPGAAAGRRSRARPGQCRSRPRAPWPCRRPGWRASARSSLGRCRRPVRLAAEAGNDRFEPGLLRPAIAVFRGSTGSPGRRCREPSISVVRLLLGGDSPPASAALAGFGKGGVAAVVEVQGFQFRLGRRSAPEQQGGNRRSAPGRRPKTAPVTFHDRHISVSPTVRPPAISAAVSARPPAGRARLARPGSGFPVGLELVRSVAAPGNW